MVANDSTVRTTVVFIVFLLCLAHVCRISLEPCKECPGSRTLTFFASHVETTVEGIVEFVTAERSLPDARETPSIRLCA